MQMDRQQIPYAQRQTLHGKERKRYRLFHRAKREYREAVAFSFHEACQQQGWLPADVAVLRVESVDGARESSR
jgi:hypothetical protein